MFPFIKETNDKFGYSFDLNSKTFSNIEFYNFIDEVHGFKYNLYYDAVMYLPDFMNWCDFAYIGRIPFNKKCGGILWNFLNIFLISEEYIGSII